MSPPVPLAWRVIEPARLGLVLHPANTPGTAVFLRASNVFRDHPEVTALLDGPMFGSPNIIRYRYFDPAAGIDYPSRRPTEGATLSVLGDWATFREGDEVAEGATVAIQGAFTVLRDGRATYPADRETEQVWRAGVGLLDDGRVLWVVGHGGIRTWADRIAAATFDGARAVRVVYTDGGHSTILWGEGQRIGYPGDDPLIFGYLVERDGPASPMPPPRPFTGTSSSPSPTSGASGGRPVGPRVGALGPATAKGSRWWYLAAVAAAAAAAKAPRLARRSRR